MSAKHNLEYLAWVYNQTGADKLTLFLYHRILASLLTGKRAGNGVRYSCFISMNDLLDVDPEFDKISNFIE